MDIDYRTEPSAYRHWRIDVEGPVARLVMTVDEAGGLQPGYRLKLNSYDLGVDIELADALNRIRFEYPAVRVVILGSGLERTFCSGANIFMLGQSDHGSKVNFCRFTNETRNGIEDSSRHSGIRFLAAVNGACAGGGYELALCCDEIVLIDDRSSAVSLPEVPLLGVLPGTGGLTRLTDKRKVRHDLADVFCTTTEGVRGEKALAWGLVDAIAKPADFAAVVQSRAAALSQGSPRPERAEGIRLPRVERTVDNDVITWTHVSATIDRQRRTATLTLRGPDVPGPVDPADILAAGATWWPLAFSRDLDDALLYLRTSRPDAWTWVIETRGNPDAVLAMDAAMISHRDHWFVREVMGHLRRTLQRLEVSTRSIFALVDEDACFVGTLFETALAADRIYQLHLPETPASEPALVLSAMNFGPLPMITGQSRLERRFCDDARQLESLQMRIGEALHAEDAFALGLVTAIPDDLDWADEVRLAIEERAAMSPDALTGLEANLRFNGRENLATRIFGRLSAWQNWIFQRPGAVGERGALKVYGTGQRPQFDPDRV